MHVIRRIDEDLQVVGGSFRFALDSPAPWASSALTASAAVSTVVVA